MTEFFPVNGSRHPPAVVKLGNEFIKSILFSVQGWEDGMLTNTSISWEDLSVNAMVESGFCCKKTTSKSPKLRLHDVLYIGLKYKFQHKKQFCIVQVESLRVGS